MPNVENLTQACSHIVDCAHETAPVDSSGDYFAVGTPAMRGNRINYSQARRIGASTFASWTARLRPKVGDLLLAREAPVGLVVRIPDEENVAPGQRTVLLRPDRSVVDPDFLFFYLLSPTAQAALAKKASGSTLPHLNVADVRELPTPGVPDLRQQRAISEVLGALDDKIATNCEMAKLVDFNLGAHLAKLAGGTRSVPLTSIGAVSTGTVRPTLKGALRYLDISAVTDGAYELPPETTWSEAPGRARREVMVFDTVWSTVRPNRRSHALLLDREANVVASTGLAVLRPHAGRAAGLYEATKRPEFARYLESVAEGSAYPAVQVGQFADAPVPALPDRAWNQFETLALPLRERAHAAVVENRRLAATRDELLPLLMSGKVRVRDAERVVSSCH